MRTRRKREAKRHPKSPQNDKKKALPRPFPTKRKPSDGARGGLRGGVPPCSIEGGGNARFIGSALRKAIPLPPAAAQAGRGRGSFWRAVASALRAGRAWPRWQYVWFWGAKGMVSGGKTIRFGGQKVTFRKGRCARLPGGASDAGRGACRLGVEEGVAALGKGSAGAARAGGKHSAAPPA